MSTKQYCLILLLCAVIVPIPALAQGRCNMQMITGTYAFQALGSSTIVTGNSPLPGDTMHWQALHAPIALTGIVDIQPDGTAEGFYWLFGGQMTSGLTPLLLKGRISDLDPDECIAILQFGVAMSPTQIVTVKDVLFILDNGRELRTTVWEPPVETMATNGIMRLIDRSPSAARSCGQQLMQGKYLIQCNSTTSLDGSLPYLSGATTLKIDIDKNGDFQGMSYSRSGVFMIMPVKGNIKVNRDCTLETQLGLSLIPGMVNVGRGVLFDEGKGGFLMPLVSTLPPPLPEIRTPYAACQVVRGER